MSNSNNYAKLAGMVMDVIGGSLDRATQFLAGISGGVYKAVGSSLKRAADSGKTVAKRAVTKEYTISQSEFLLRTKNMNHFVRNSNGEISVIFGYSGCVIPLTRFNTRVNSSGQVVPRSSGLALQKFWSAASRLGWVSTGVSMSGSASAGSMSRNGMGPPPRRVTREP